MEIISGILPATKISNHPTFPDVERYVRIESDIRTKQSIKLECLVQYFKNNVDISEEMSKKSFLLIADNTQRKNLYVLNGVTKYSADNGATPLMEDVLEHEVINTVPQYNEDMSPKMITVQKQKSIGLFEYFQILMTAPVSTKSQYDTTLLMNDQAGRFNQF